MRSDNLLEFIGICGAFCMTCPAFINKTCKGCKLCYDNGTRDISKAKCKMKVCCLTNMRCETCADCNEFEECEILREFYGNKGYKYSKYKQALDFIRSTDYETFLKYALLWKNAYGKLPTK